MEYCKANRPEGYGEWKHYPTVKQFLLNMYAVYIELKIYRSNI